MDSCSYLFKASEQFSRVHRRVGIQDVEPMSSQLCSQSHQARFAASSRSDLHKNTRRTKNVLNWNSIWLYSSSCSFVVRRQGTFYASMKTCTIPRKTEMLHDSPHLPYACYRFPLYISNNNKGEICCHIELVTLFWRFTVCGYVNRSKRKYMTAHLLHFPLVLASLNDDILFQITYRRYIPSQQQSTKSIPREI